MPETLYETLGVSPEATPAQVRAAYRRLVLKHHPDQAGDQSDVRAFIEVTKAYEVLSDADRRKEYDRLLALRSKPRIQSRIPEPPSSEPARAKAQPPTAKADPTSLRTQVAEDLSRLIRLYGKGAFRDAERLARQIVQKDPRQATPYAILGDLARAKGELDEAAKMYAFAVQMDPRNPAYQRKHEELVSKIGAQARFREQGESRSGLAGAVSFCLVLVAGAYVALAQEPPVFQDAAWISTWTFGLVVMLFLAGVAVGVGLTLSGLLDRFESLSSNSLNRVSPALALASVAIVNFWAAIAIYALVGARERSYTYSVSRLVSAVGLVILVMAASAAVSDRIDPIQVLIWGGNLVYTGAICGWMSADTLRDE
jgi:curved DNA-binding protein CbpA